MTKTTKRIMVALLLAALSITMLPLTAQASKDTEWFDNLWRADSKPRKKSSSKSGKSKRKKSKKSYKVKVNTKKNETYVYEKINGEWVKIDTMDCCTGKDSTPTPKGSFKTGKKESSFKKGDKSYNYVTYFSGNCAFHSTPESEGDYNNRSLGKNESHGCIRLDPKDAKKIQSLPEGTEVVVE